MATTRKTLFLAISVVVLALAVAVWSRLPRQEGDPDFTPMAVASAFQDPGPRVLIDEGHVNLHTVDGRYAPFARLARAAGFRVDGVSGWMQDHALGQSDILVIANAMGYTGAADQLAAILGMDRWVHLTRSAFNDDEIVRVVAWVKDGGSLLLVADHRPAGGASARLARAFSVEMTDGYVADPAHHDTSANVPGVLVFDREGRLIGDHPVLEGRTSEERVNRVVTFTGQALRASGTATTLLRLSPTATERAGRHRDAAVRSVAGLAQAVALEHGKGRVIVLGEAAMATSQVVGPVEAQRRMGLQWPGSDNERFVVNVLNWLARVPMNGSTSR